MRMHNRLSGSLLKFYQAGQENTLTVTIIIKYCFAVDSSGNNMVQGTRNIYS